MPWTEADLPDLTGRRVIVTGANSGLGYETARALAQHGATVTLAVRSVPKGRDAADRIRGLTPSAATVTVGGARPREPRVGPGVRAALDGGEPRRAAPAGQQRRRDGHPAPGDRGRLRDAAGHQPPGPLRADRAAARRAGRRPAGAGGDGEQRGAPVRPDGLRRPDGRPGATTRGGPTARASWPTCCSPASCSGACSAPAFRSTAMAAHPGYAATNLQGVAPSMRGSSIGERVTELGNRLIAQPATMGALPTLYAATAPGLPGNTFVGPDRWLGSAWASSRRRPQPRRPEPRRRRAVVASQRRADRRPPAAGVALDSLAIGAPGAAAQHDPRPTQRW